MEEIHRVLIFETLRKVHPVSTAMVSMWIKDKPYDRMLFLRFRFGKLDKNDPIYERLEVVITSFKGALNWALFTSEAADNYLLVPAIFLEFREKYGTWDTNEMIDFFGLEWFKSIIDKGREDIPALAAHIEHNAKKINPPDLPARKIEM